MCGIFCSVPLKKGGDVSEYLEKADEELLIRRGPDTFRILTVNNVMMGGFVLWQQGTEICSQPVECKNIALLLNGDFFNNNLDGLSDTEWLTKNICECKNDVEICDFLRTVKGPYSIVFFNKDTGDLYFGRDSLGRNTLLMKNTNSHLQVLSTAYFRDRCPSAVMELPPVGIYKLNVKDPSQCIVFPWNNYTDKNLEIQIGNMQNTMKINITMGHCIKPEWLNISHEPKEKFNFYDLCGSANTLPTDLMGNLLNHRIIITVLDKFSALLENSVKQRVQKTPKYCLNCIKLREECEHSKIALLFSGGIDCSILAVLVNKFADQKDPIDLINIAFQKESAVESNWDVPDRCSGRDSFKELQELCPSRKWNFVEVNVSREKLHQTLHEHIKHLIYPLDTILDESIGCAFWFASRGIGICNTKQYNSPARVVIVGSGADELFGGYMRHRNAYNRCNGDELEKQNSVLAELEKDWQRLPSRNLARDDRVIGDNGKTVRAPFIEEDLVQYVRTLKPYERSNYKLAEGLGDKLFLRIYGYRLGLRFSVHLKKRAIQFGSRIANKKQNAKDRSNYLNFT